MNRSNAVLAARFPSASRLTLLDAYHSCSSPLPRRLRHPALLPSHTTAVRFPEPPGYSVRFPSASPLTLLDAYHSCSSPLPRRLRHPALLPSHTTAVRFPESPGYLRSASQASHNSPSWTHITRAPLLFPDVSDILLCSHPTPLQSVSQNHRGTQSASQASHNSPSWTHITRAPLLFPDVSDILLCSHPTPLQSVSQNHRGTCGPLPKRLTTHPPGRISLVLLSSSQTSQTSCSAPIPHHCSPFPRTTGVLAVRFPSVSQLTLLDAYHSCSSPLPRRLRHPALLPSHTTAVRFPEPPGYLRSASQASHNSPSWTHITRAPLLFPDVSDILLCSHPTPLQSVSQNHRGTQSASQASHNSPSWTHITRAPLLFPDVSDILLCSHPTPLQSVSQNHRGTCGPLPKRLTTHPPGRISLVLLSSSQTSQTSCSAPIPHHCSPFPRTTGVLAVRFPSVSQLTLLDAYHSCSSPLPRRLRHPALLPSHTTAVRFPEPPGYSVRFPSVSQLTLLDAYHSCSSPLPRRLRHPALLPSHTTAVRFPEPPGYLRSASQASHNSPSWTHITRAPLLFPDVSDILLCSHPTPLQSVSQNHRDVSDILLCSHPTPLQSVSQNHRGTQSASQASHNSPSWTHITRAPLLFPDVSDILLCSHPTPLQSVSQNHRGTCGPLPKRLTTHPPARISLASGVRPTGRQRIAARQVARRQGSADVAGALRDGLVGEDH
ncbi:unnamed protein product [Closterium sp. Naga37s-1]|nr:unnamed protein product [Closterium sp. Naga37s-1]